MIKFDKTYSDNPFIDNIIYYAKTLAVNCTVKDEEEALSYETKKSLNRSDIYIMSVEGTATYDTYSKYPEELLEKYITPISNLDIYANDADEFRLYLVKNYVLNKRNDILFRVSDLAKRVYIDHYNMMTKYINTIGPNWLEDNKLLYDKCNTGTATYYDLFNVIPKETKKRIFTEYLNNYDYTDMDILCEDLAKFTVYLSSRNDTQVNIELNNIVNAMSKVFVSHYDMMVQRKYISKDSKNINHYMLVDSTDAYNKCINGSVTYKDLYNVISKNELISSLYYAIGENKTEQYELYKSINYLEYYFSINTNREQVSVEQAKLLTEMKRTFLNSYNVYLDYNMYEKCMTSGTGITYFDLVNYIPFETKKMIINSAIEECTNISVYSKNKKLLNEYLNTLSEEEAANIKRNLTKDMLKWYPLHYEEVNNYYRAFIGLPPIDEITKTVCEDTLFRSYSTNTNSYIEFGNEFIDMLPSDINYPDKHWETPIYELDKHDIYLLSEYGILDSYAKRCGYNIGDIRYRYLKYLGSNKLNLYECRKANKFQLLSLPTVDDEDAIRKFTEAYNVNVDYCIHCVYSYAHKFMSDYYDKFMIVFILVNTIMDMLSDITENIINREIFDIRCIKWLFESFGVPFYSEIPVKYLKAMIKNMNTLLKYKSSTKNMVDICKLFGFVDTKVFNYYLFKEVAKDLETGEYITNDKYDINYDIDLLWVRDNNGSTESIDGFKYTKLTEYSDYDENKYFKTISIKNNDGTISQKKVINNDLNVYIRQNENDFMLLKDSIYFSTIGANTNPAILKFIKVPEGESVTKYKNDPNYIISYDEITINGEPENTWDGGLLHHNLYNKLLDYEFNIAKTKYVSVESVTDLTEQAFEISYFYNMLFDNLYSEDNLTIEIPILKANHKIKLMDVICYLFALTYFYYGLEDNIMYSPTQILYVKGYNFNEALNAIMSNPNYFSDNGKNIFDINERIIQDNYNYKEAFNNYDMKAFNLEADIDELNEWLMNNYNISLDDFIIKIDTDGDNKVTLRNFFSLNNSYYQKNILREQNIHALAYNQIIKTSYDIDIKKVIKMIDYDGVQHRYINGKEIINNSSSIIYISDPEYYIISNNGTKHNISYMYRKSNGTYNRVNNDYYYYNNGEYKKLFNDAISVLNHNGEKIFSTNRLYVKNNRESFVDITSNFIRSYPNDHNKKYILFGNYWVKNQNNIWELNKNKAYVVVYNNGTYLYKPYNEVQSHENIIVTEDKFWIKLDNGDYIKYTDTDFYNTEDMSEYEYDEDQIYINTNMITEYNVVDPDGTIRYYMKLQDYYDMVNWQYNQNNLYIYDIISNTYISEADLISPSNCYYLSSDGTYRLIINDCWNYIISNNNTSNILILKPDYNYDSYTLTGSKYTLDNTVNNKIYAYDSDEDYILLLNNSLAYNNTKLLSVIFNKEIDSKNASIIINDDKYNPELTDNIWDENDWVYNDDNIIGLSGAIIGKHGENIWYYRNPEVPNDETSIIKDASLIGAGFTIPTEAYLDSIKLENGEKYYMSFDIESNFNTNIQIYNSNDNSVISNADKIYNLTKGLKQHISHIFTANGNSDASIKFLIYNLEDNPIHIGDYIIVSNIRFMKAYSDTFIPQDIESFDKLQELYKTNKMIYDYLINLMNKESDYNKYQIYKKLYDSLMISKYNKEAFKLDNGSYAKTYTDFLKTRDNVLYYNLIKIKSLDHESMVKEIPNNITNIIQYLDESLKEFSYIHSYFPGVSANFIQQYIIKVINWFKSWKVHLLGINTVYKFGNIYENLVKILENLNIDTDFDNIIDKVYIHDLIDDINISDNIGDNVTIKDRIRIISLLNDRIEYHDDNTSLSLILKGNDISVIIKDGNVINIKSSNAGFNTSDNNMIVQRTDIKSDQLFAQQVIDSINLYTGDYMDWRILNE